MAGLQVGQACGVLLLPGFGVSSSSPQVPGHPTSICDAGVNLTLDIIFFGGRGRRGDKGRSEGACIPTGIYVVFHHLPFCNTCTKILPSPLNLLGDISPTMQ